MTDANQYQHSARKVLGSFLCKVCQIQFPARDELLKHILEHLEQDSYECSGISFDRKISSENHGYGLGDISHEDEVPENILPRNIRSIIWTGSVDLNFEEQQKSIPSENQASSTVDDGIGQIEQKFTPNTDVNESVQNFIEDDIDIKFSISENPDSSYILPDQKYIPTDVEMCFPEKWKNNGDMDSEFIVSHKDTATTSAVVKKEDGSELHEDSTNTNVDAFLPQNNKAVYKCPHPRCSKIFSESVDVKWHVRAVHQDVIIIARSTIVSKKVDRPFRCRFCLSSFKRKKNLKLHLDVHKWTTNRSNVTLKKRNKQARKEANKQCPSELEEHKSNDKSSASTYYGIKTEVGLRLQDYEPEQSGQALSESQPFPGNELEGTDSTPVEENGCPFIEITETETESEDPLASNTEAKVQDGSILNDAVTTKKKSFTCRHCPKVWSSPSAVHLHTIRKHPGGEKLCMCSLCCRLFLTEVLSKRHLAVHSYNEHEQLKCKECKAIFSVSEKRSYEEHIETHKKKTIKNIKCHLCPKQFSSHLKLKVHLGCVHSSPQRKFECKVCLRRFITESGLQTHEGLHTKLWRCSSCHAVFNVKSALEIHRVMHAKCQSLN